MDTHFIIRTPLYERGARGREGGFRHKFTNNSLASKHLHEKWCNSYWHFISTTCWVCEVTSKDSAVKYRHRAIVLLRSFGQIKDLFSSIDLVHNQGFWQFTFHGVHFDYDAQNSFAVHDDSRTPKWKIVVHGVTKISLPAPIPPPPHH